MISIDRDNEIEVLVLAGLDQQRDHVHHDCSTAGSPLQLGGPSPNGRVHNSLQIATRERISEDNLGKPCSVQVPVFEYLHAKTVDDRGKRWSARLNYLTGQYVGVDDDRTARSKLGGHHAFPGRDAAGQAYPHHGHQLMRAGAGLRQAAPRRCMSWRLGAVKG